MLDVILISAPTVFSQTSISIAQQLTYHSNSFFNYKQLPDLNDYTGLTFSHIFESEKIQSRIYYQGDLNWFRTYTDRLYHNHALGYDGYSISRDEKKAIYFGLNLSWYEYQDQYSLYNSRWFEGYTNMMIYFLPDLIGRFGYILYKKSYSELPEFNYWEHYFFAQLNTYFQTGTSLTALLNYGLKDYIPMQTSEGRGRRATIDYFEMPGVDQLVSSIKVAQSLGMKTSLSLKYLYRMNPGLAPGSAMTMDSDELLTENELFDDRYGYSGHELSVTFTHFLRGHAKTELGVSRLWKNYQNRQIFDLEGNISLLSDSRTDTRAVIWANFSRSFGVNWGVKRIKISLEGGYWKNNSNDLYYQFDNYFGSLGLEFKLK